MLLILDHPSSLDGRYLGPLTASTVIARAIPIFTRGGNARAGAMGLMQTMSGTRARLRTRHRLGTDPFDVQNNIMARVAYRREIHNRYGNASAMLAAYNAGPGRYHEHLSRRRPLPAVTFAYLARLGQSRALLASAMLLSSRHLIVRRYLFPRPQP